MSKLIFADIPMVFKSKMLYIIFGMSAFLGFDIVLISFKLSVCVLFCCIFLEVVNHGMTYSI